MFLNKFIWKSRIRWLESWIVGMILWMVAGPILAQDGWRSFYSPEIAARAAVLMNAATGEILFSREPHLRLPPASTTKILSALVALERLAPDSRVWVSPQAASAPPSRIGLHVGEAASTQDLLYGLLLKSGNDAAESLAEAAGGSVYGFANLMNAKAMQVGARNSHFMNPHGLPDEDHYSTAYDLALIFRHAMHNPMFADIVRTRDAALRIESAGGAYGDWRTVSVHNTNRLLASYEGARGGKTGFTRKARRCFVGEVDRGGVRLIVSILNSPTSGTLWEDARTLLDYGFARYGLAPPPPMQPSSEPQPIMVYRSPVMAPDAERVAMIQPAFGNNLEPALVRRTPVTARADSRLTVTWPAANAKTEPTLTPIRRASVPDQTGFRPSVAQPADEDEDGNNLEPALIRRAPVTAQANSRPAAAQPATKDEDELDLTPIRRAPVTAQANSRPAAAQPATKDEDELDLTPIRRAPVTAQVNSRPTAAQPATKDEDELDLTLARQQPTIAWTSPRPVVDRPAVRIVPESAPSRRLVVDRPAVRIVPESAPSRRMVADRTDSRSTVAQRSAIKNETQSSPMRQSRTRAVMGATSGGKSQLQSQPSTRMVVAQSMVTGKTREANTKARTLLASAKPIVEPAKVGAKTNSPARTAMMVAMATPSAKTTAAAKTKTKPTSDMTTRATSNKPTAASGATVKSDKRVTTTKVAATRAEPAAPKSPQKNAKR